MFDNAEVPLDSLPQVEGLAWQPLHRRFARRLQTGALLRFAVPAALGATAHLMAARASGGTVLASAPWLAPTAWTVLAVLLARALIWPMIAVPRWGYVVRERDILYRSGVLWLSVKAVPFNRVQHTKIDSGPLDRRFGLANLSIFPAGAGGHRIRGLGADTAERLRAFVSAQIEAEGESETGEGATGEGADLDC